MVGDSHVLVVHLPGKLGYLPDRMGAVAVTAMDVEIGTDVFPSNQLWKRSLQGSLNFPPILPYLGRDERKIQKAINVLLIFSGDSIS